MEYFQTVSALFGKSLYTYVNGNLAVFEQQILEVQKQQKSNQRPKLNICEKNRITLLTYAIDHRRPEATALILRNGADPGFVPQNTDVRLSPMDLAFGLRYSPSLIKLLVSYGADYNRVKRLNPDAKIFSWLEEIEDTCKKANFNYNQGLDYLYLANYKDAASFFKVAEEYFDLLISHELKENDNSQLPGYKFEQAYLDDYYSRRNTAIKFSKGYRANDKKSEKSPKFSRS